MNSWRARRANRIVRWRMRRRDWGKTEQAGIDRARRKLGAPWSLRLLRRRGLSFEQIREGAVRGEWVKPERVEPKGPNSGTILYLHGGAYLAGSPASHQPITKALARLTGYRVFSLEYRCAPEHRFPTALYDAMRAYRWLLKQEGVGNIAVVGDSAGGGLALSLILRAQAKGLPLPACAVCFSPWTDLTNSGASIHINNDRCHMFYPENLRACAAVYVPKEQCRPNKYASPLFADLEDFEKLPPLLLQVSSTELLLDDSCGVARNIERAKGDGKLKTYDDVFRRWREIKEVQGISRLEIYDDVFHCWQMLYGILPEARIALELAARFINKNVSSTGAARRLSDADS